MAKENKLDIDLLRQNKDVPLLVAALSFEGDFRLRKQAADVLEELGWKPADVRTAALFSLAKGKFSWCVQIGEPAVGPLIAVLRDDNPKVRAGAAGALGSLRAQAAVKELCALLRDRDPAVVEAASNALGQIGEPAAESLVKVMFDSLEHSIIHVALKALLKMGEPGVKQLIEALSRRNWIIAGTDIDTINRCDDPQILDLLIRLLRDLPHFNVKGTVVGILGKRRDPRAVDMILTAYNAGCLTYDTLMLKTAPAYFQTAAENIREFVLPLPVIAYKVDMAYIGLEYGKALLKSGIDLAGPTFLVEECVRALGAIKDARVVQPLIESFQSLAGKRYAPAALAEIGDRRALEPLRTLLNDPDGETRKAAAKALKKLA